MRTIFSGATIFILVLMGACSVIFVCFREQIPELFKLGAESSQIASSILVVACAYMIFDGFQTIASGALRGMSDVRIIAVASFVSYWIVGCPAALILAFPAGLQGVGIWCGLALGLATIAVILGLRMRGNLRLRETSG